MAITQGERYHFLFGTLAQFETLKAGNKVDPDDLYFITDTHQIYVGEDLYTGQVQFVDTFPTTPSQGVIYVNPTTHETKMWNGTAWQTIVPPISTTLNNTTVDTNLVTAKAIRDYVTGISNECVTDVTYDDTTQKFTVTYGDATTSELPLKKLITGASYDATTGEFTFTVANGDSIVVNTPKEDFLKDVQYDKTTHIITFTMENGATFDVNIADLIDTYTVKSSATIELTMVNNEITAVVKKSNAEDNILVLNEDGLFVPKALIGAIENTNSITLAVDENDTLTATLQISKDENNKLSVKEDGLFVDLSNYYTKPEIDSFTTWKEIV